MFLAFLIINTALLLAVILLLFFKSSEKETFWREFQKTSMQLTSALDQSSRANREEQNRSIERLTFEMKNSIDKMRETMEIGRASCRERV